MEEIVNIETGEIQQTGVEYSRTGLALSDLLTFERWQELGNQLKYFEGAIQWWVGDWLNFGERKWGEMYAQAVDPSQAAIWKNYKWVSCAVDSSLRNDKLSWSHHLEVAKLEPNEQEKYLGLAALNNMTVRELREAVHTRNLIDAPPLPQGRYSVIYADPPWPVGSIVMDKWESPIDDKYPVMELDKIKSLPVADLAADDCSLFLWTTQTFLPDAFDVLGAWGFKYFCCITWDKGGGWTQNGFHKRTELLLYAYKGSINVEQHGAAIPTLISEAKGAHSKKPDTIRDLIASKTPEPRLEMFAREGHDGWVVWGNEVKDAG